MEFKIDLLSVTFLPPEKDLNELLRYVTPFGYLKNKTKCMCSAVIYLVRTSYSVQEKASDCCGVCTELTHSKMVMSQLNLCNTKAEGLMCRFHT